MNRTKRNQVQYENASEQKKKKRTSEIKYC